MDLNMELSCALISELLFIIFLTGIAFAGARFLMKLLSTSKHVWQQSLADALCLPLRCFILLQTFFTIFSLFFTDQFLIGRLAQLRVVCLTGVLAWLLLRTKYMFEKLLERYFTTNSADKIFITAADKIITLGIIMVALIMILDAFGISLTALFAFGGISGIAISLAAKDVIANFFGGLMIYINRPFVIGDWIRSSNKGFEGVVEDIGWYMTSIRTRDRRPLYIPNALVIDAMVENYGKMHNKRLKTIIGIHYEDLCFVEQIVTSIDTFLHHHHDVDQAQKISVSLINLANYALEIECSAFIKTMDPVEFSIIKQDVLLNIAKIIQHHGARIALPININQLKQGNSL
ncbi:mechanosensitive ion channel family protein [bacterium]|nr:MAG: mechanosensitive ion channel family protein [bacterium]